MPIPPFTHEGILPPFVGASGPGGSREDMTPYKASSVELAHTFGFDENRRDIILGWLMHREHLRSIGFADGFQWIDGSFVEQKEPKDIDVLSFLWVSDKFDQQSFTALQDSNPEALHRHSVKKTHRVDQMICDLAGHPESLVSTTRYFLGLFSHRRNDSVWKGMLEIRLNTASDDATAVDFLNQIGAES